MDAVEYLIELKRLCNQYEGCHGCPFEKEKSMCVIPAILEEPEKVVKTVEKWSEEHPVKTRQSEFLKMFPNVPKLFGHVDICPKELGEKIVCDAYCGKCKEAYWLAEVE